METVGPQNKPSDPMAGLDLYPALQLYLRSAGVFPPVLQRFNLPCFLVQNKTKKKGEREVKNPGVIHTFSKRNGKASAANKKFDFAILIKSNKNVTNLFYYLHMPFNTLVL